MKIALIYPRIYSTEYNYQTHHLKMDSRRDNFGAVGWCHNVTQNQEISHGWSHLIQFRTAFDLLRFVRDEPKDDPFATKSWCKDVCWILSTFPGKFVTGPSSFLSELLLKFMNKKIDYSDLFSTVIKMIFFNVLNFFWIKLFMNT